MLEARSAVTSLDVVSLNGVTIAEAPGFTLTQVAGAEKDVKKVLGKLPAKVGIVLDHEGTSLFRIGPRQFWVLGGEPQAAAGVYLTPLSSGRTRMALAGPRAREVLSACAAIDFHPGEFQPGQFVMTGIHHTPVLIHCTGADTFHIYALRTFAVAVWEWLVDAAVGLTPAE